MKPLYTFDTSALSLTELTYRERVEHTYKEAWSEGLNPRIAELTWPESASDAEDKPSLKFTLWGDDAPWRADEALAEIAAASGGEAQDPTLEPYFAYGFFSLWFLRAERDRELMAAIRYRPAAPFRVLAPTLAADWNIGADVSIEADPHRRRNSLGRRLAMAVCYEIDRRKGYPGRLAAAKLFPCTASGDEYPHPVDSFLLQIHR